MRVLIVLLMIAISFSAPRAEAPVSEQLARAQLLEKRGDLEGALAIYKRVLSEEPSSKEAFKGAKRIMFKLKRYDELIGMLRALKARYPEGAVPLDLRLDLGEALYKSGRREEAEREWNAALLQRKGSPLAYRMVAGVYLSVGDLGSAAKVYLMARRRLSNDRIFSLELANVYSYSMDFERASEEYVKYLGDHPGHYPVIERVFSSFPKDKAVISGVLRVLERAVREDPGNMSKRLLLSSYYLDIGHPDKAFSVLHSGKVDARMLAEFADQCRSKGYPKFEMSAYRELAARYPSSPRTLASLLRMADIQTEMGLYEEAISSYGKVAEALPLSPQGAEALWRIGRIKLDFLHDPDGALRAFKDLLSHPAAGQFKYKAELGIGDCLVASGKLDLAMSVYGKLERTIEAGSALFRMAEIDYYRGDFEAALAKLRAVSERNPREDYVNDALSLMLLIEENITSDPGGLKAFASAQLKSRQCRYDEASSLLKGISETSPLADDALLELGKVLSDMGRYGESIDAYARLISEYPGSPLSPDARIAIARVYMSKLGDIEEAARHYEAFLESFPDHVMAVEARRRLREIRNATSGGEKL